MAGSLFQVKLHGMDELKRVIDTLPDKVKKKVAREGSAVPARALRKELVKATPVDTGKMKKSWRVSVRTLPRYVRARVINIARHAHLVELGTQPRKRKSGASTGQMIANPFARNTFHAMRNQLIQMAVEGMRLAIVKHIGKITRGPGR